MVTSLDSEETALSGEELILFSDTSEELSVIWEGFDDSPGKLAAVSKAEKSSDAGSVGVPVGASAGMLSSDCTLDNFSEPELAVFLVVHADKSNNPQSKQDKLMIRFTLISIFNPHVVISAESI